MRLSAVLPETLSLPLPVTTFSMLISLSLPNSDPLALPLLRSTFNPLVAAP